MMDFIHVMKQSVFSYATFYKNYEANDSGIKMRLERERTSKILLRKKYGID